MTNLTPKSIDMTYNDIASVSGKGGLFRVIKPTRTGMILESLDDRKQKLVAGLNQKVSALSEISIFTNTNDGSVSLASVLKSIHDEFGKDTGLDSRSDADELMAFLKHVLPDFDETRVYPSDVKKLVSWYNILVKHVPELLKTDGPEEK